MKKNRIYLGMLFSAMVLLFANCTVREGEMAGAHTQRGFEIYKSCEFNTLNFIYNKVDICFKFNAWLEADSALKDLLEDKFFPEYKLRKAEDGIYGLYNGVEQVFIIETGGKPLSDPNAQWILSWKGTDNDLNRQNYGNDLPSLASSFIKGTMELHVDHADTAGNSWHVSIVDQDSLNAFLDLNIVSPMRLMPQTLFDDDFTVTGTGKFYFLEGRIWSDNGGQTGWQHQTFLAFDIKSPMQFVFTYDDNSFHGGAIGLVASNLSGETLPVNAEFKGPYNVAITYKNQTQIWNVNTEMVVE